MDLLKKNTPEGWKEKIWRVIQSIRWSKRKAAVRKQIASRLSLQFWCAYRSNSYGDFIHKFCRENVFKLTSSFSSWPSEAYQVCMIKFIALRLFLLNCKVNPKVWVKSIQKNEDLIFRLIFKTLSIRFQNSIDLFVWPVNKLIKKNQAFLRLHYPNSPIQREKKWNEYWRVTSKKERKFMSSNQNLSTEIGGWKLISL